MSQKSSHYNIKMPTQRTVPLTHHRDFSAAYAMGRWCPFRGQAKNHLYDSVFLKAKLIVPSTLPCSQEKNKNKNNLKSPTNWEQISQQQGKAPLQPRFGSTSSMSCLTQGSRRNTENSTAHTETISHRRWHAVRSSFASFAGHAAFWMLSLTDKCDN